MVLALDQLMKARISSALVKTRNTRDGRAFAVLLPSGSSANRSALSEARLIISML